MKRSRFTEEQIIGILREAEPGATAKEVCRRHGISERSFYRWKAKFGDLDVSHAKRAAGQPIKGGVYCTCVARGPNLFGDDSEELKAIRATLGDFPLVGFFAYGEICNNRLYGYTGVLALFL